ncbi:MAG: ATP-binding protein [Bacteroidota bacterium]
MNTIPLLNVEANSIYDLISDAVISVDLDNCIKGWNPAAEKLYGWTSKEAIFQPLDMLLHTEYVHASSGEVLQQVWEGGTWKGEVIHLHQTHKPVHVLSSLSLKRDNAGNPEELVWINKDISHIKEFEESMVSYAKSTDIIHKVVLACNQAENLTELYKQIIHQTLRLLDFDAGGVFLVHDHSQKVIMEYGHNLPENAWSHFHGGSIYDFPMSRVFLHGKPFITENYDLMAPHHYKLSGFLSMASIPIFLGENIMGALSVGSKKRHILSSYEKKIICSIGQQIGVVISRLQTQQKLHSLNQQLGDKVSQHSSQVKNSTKHLQEFTSVVAHDLREPIRMILSYLDLAQLDGSSSISPQGKEYMNIARSGARRMMGMLEGIRSYSRITSQAPNLEPVDLEKSIQDACQILCLSIRENNANVTSENLPLVQADPLQMIQLLQNLIHNAIKYRREPDPHIHISAEDKDTHWMFRIEDNGRGINQSVAPHIFQMFRRGEGARGEGSLGIGLSICKGIIDRHQGEIWMESKEGIGTIFYFTMAKSQK